MPVNWLERNAPGLVIALMTFVVLSSVILLTDGYRGSQERQASNQQEQAGQPRATASNQDTANQGSPGAQTPDNSAKRALPTVADWWMVGITGLAVIGGFITLAFLRGQTAAAIRAAQDAQKTAELASAAFVLDHQPELVIRRIVLMPDARERQIAKVVIENKGRSPAMSVTANFEWYVWRRVPPVIPFEIIGMVSGLIADKIPPGQRGFCEIWKVSDSPYPPNIPWDEDGTDHVAGVVHYQDQAGTQRHVACCYRLNHESGRFEKVDDVDYNYTC